MKQSPPWSLAGNSCQAAGVTFPCGWTSAVLLHPPHQRLPVLWQPAVFAGTALPFAPLIFILLPQPCSRTCSYLKHSFVGWWLLMSSRVRSALTPSPGALFGMDVLWEFFCGNSLLCWSYSGSLWICTMWQTWPLLAQGLQYLIYYWTFKVRHAVAVNTLLYHTWSTSDLSSAGALWGRHHRGMEVQHLEEMMKAFYFWGLNFSSWLQKSES